MRQGGGAKAWLGLFALQPGVEFFDLGFQFGDLIIENAGAIGNQINFFFEPGHRVRNGVLEWWGQNFWFEML